jgi:hypothetical protein
MDDIFKVINYDNYSDTLLHKPIGLHFGFASRHQSIVVLSIDHAEKMRDDLTVAIDAARAQRAMVADVPGLAPVLPAEAL